MTRACFFDLLANDRCKKHEMQEDIISQRHHDIGNHFSRVTICFRPIVSHRACEDLSQSKSVAPVLRVFLQTLRCEDPRPIWGLVIPVCNKVRISD
jgi:hypothetical protein